MRAPVELGFFMFDTTAEKGKLPWRLRGGDEHRHNHYGNVAISSVLDYLL
ncbi:hypothetical protein WN943_001864 [Citrus x changshan-huyou]